MASKQGRKLPQWYLDKVNMAAEVYANAPDVIDTSLPHVNHANSGGQGVSAQRWGAVAPIHKRVTSATQST